MTGRDYVLPDRLEPKPGESLPGLIMRYAALYGFDKPLHLFHRVSSGFKGVATRSLFDPSSPEGRALGRLLHLDEARLRRMSNWHPAPKCVAVAGHRVHEDLAPIGRRQVCPECLRESAHHREAWLLTSVPVCPVHARRLLHSCPDCRTPLLWSGAGVAYCGNDTCGTDLRTVEAEAVTDRQAAAARGLLRLLDGEGHPSGMEFGDVLHAVIVLGGVLQGRFRLKRLVYAVQVDRDDLPEVLAHGWEALHPWPSAYHGFLELLREDRGFQPGMALEQAFGELLRVLRRAAGRGWAAPLLQEMVAYAAGSADITVRPDVLERHGDAPRRDWMTMNESARVLGVSVDTVTRAAKRLSLDLTPPQRGLQRRLSAERVHALAEANRRAGDLVTVDQAATMLGISAPTVGHLARLGVIAGIPPEERIKASVFIRRAEIQAILDAFERAAGAAPVVEEPGDDHRVLGEAGAKDGYGVTGITRAVLAGTLRPIAVWRDGPGLRRYLFPRVIRVLVTYGSSSVVRNRAPEHRPLR